MTIAAELSLFEIFIAQYGVPNQGGQSDNINEP